VTILEPILYANGALRLTRHGAGKGGTVLVHVPTGRQVDIPDGEELAVEQICVETDATNPAYVEGVIDDLRETYSWYKPSAPNFYHN
jgi:hypothetical protein